MFFEEQDEQLCPEQKVLRSCRAARFTENKTKSVQTDYFTYLFILKRNTYPVKKEVTAIQLKENSLWELSKDQYRSNNLNMNIILITYRMGIDTELGVET